MSALDSESEYAEPCEFLDRRKSFFYDPEIASSSGASHVPSQPLNIQSPKGTLSHDSGLPLDTRNTMGTSKKTFLESLLAREAPSSALCLNSRNV